jgi:predicted Zn-dependent protease
VTSTESILGLTAVRRARRPVRSTEALDGLFRRLAACASHEALPTEDRIWDLWMHHPHSAAAAALEAATRDIAAKRYDIAETRLTMLLRRAPAFAEAWHKRATLYYLLGRDDECLQDIKTTLELEPRHFGAMLHFAEMLLGAGAAADARFAFHAVLLVHPHVARAKDVLSDNP